MTSFSGLADDNSDGLFGTAVATMGMLSTAAYVLTMDVFGYANLAKLKALLVLGQKYWLSPEASVPGAIMPV